MVFPNVPMEWGFIFAKYDYILFLRFSMSSTNGEILSQNQFDCENRWIVCSSMLGAGGWWWAAVLRNVEHLARIPVQMQAQHSTAPHSTAPHLFRLHSAWPGADYKLVHSLLPATTGQMSIMK